ncbi:alpha-galactosidase [Brachybacterium sp. Marseille-Q7125]|uniref:alpha-galactosidase n=1 Tax=Brachybacterium sp. Marseille-Q7125 TaxID=2932815 RepID=UPI001FF2B4C7|nr:alpha-galactosidase [Brachybacterium sp. Marseille-Q7125]
MTPTRRPAEHPVLAPVPDRTHRIHLRSAGVSVVLDVTDGRAPAIPHWGADLGELSANDLDAVCESAVEAAVNNAVDVPVRLGILPAQADGWLGRPGLTGSRPDGSGWAPRLHTEAITLDGQPLTATHVQSGPGRVVIKLADEPQSLAVELTLEPLDSGLLRVRGTVTNTGETPYALDELTVALPVPARASELLDFAGRWARERTPQRSTFGVGTHLRENRRGRTGADSAHVLHAGTPGVGFSHGEVWGVHLGFSGNHRHLAEQVNTGTKILAGGEMLTAGEVVLDPDASYTSPWLYATYGAGLDQAAHRFHRFLRSREHHVSTRRPVTLNVWEAVYFDHDLARLRDLADRAAELGVERYVLDDGWFGSRRDDHSGLGDWVVSAEVWPDGLSPLIDHVTDLGMEFGLWFEPEMVNEDSEVARAHPEWILGPDSEQLPVESRHQQVLNLTIPGAYEHVKNQILALLDEYDIGYIKWDQNRDLLEAATRATGRAATHEQTLAAYRLMDELKAAHPGLEIEACASGGARVDLGVLEHTDRVWVSDCIDPLERQLMNRWTSQLLPLELMGSHIASGRSHTTGRLHTLSFRGLTALFGHLGIEWDLAQASEAELTELRAWIALYKEQRELLFTGDLVRVDRGEDVQWMYGVLSPGRDQGLFVLAAVDRQGTSQHARLTFPGLDPAARYRLRPLIIGERPHGLNAPAWWQRAEEQDGIVLPGGVLTTSGLAAPLLDPEQGVLLSLTREHGDTSSPR